MAEDYDHDLWSNDRLQDGAGFQNVSIPASEDTQETKGYAKLVFPDGDFIITTHDLMIGRNMALARHMKHLHKRERHAQRAQIDLENYEQEPSQPSQPGDGVEPGHPSNSSQSLEGRPARALPSNFSERGGAVHYEAQSDDDHSSRHRSKRRSLQYSNSSTTSVAPASLHPSQVELSHSQLWDVDGEPTSRTYARLPIHTMQLEDIRKISQEHLLISYNFQIERWELKIVGNRAFVNEELQQRDTILPLAHNDEIIVAGVSIVFKLPDNYRHSPGLTRGTFSEHQGSELLSDEESGDAIDAERESSDDADSLDSDEEEAADGKTSRNLAGAKQRLKKEKKLKSKAGGEERSKMKIKFAKQTNAVIPNSPEAAKKSEKGKKPKVAEKSVKEPGDADKALSPSADPPVFEPGSVLAEVPQDQLPQKRKGPGRPPKNGLVSKKDERQVLKKQREYEKRGEKPPTYAELVEEVRKEAKLKEQQSKNGQVPSMEVGTVIQSIEDDVDIQTFNAISNELREAPNSEKAQTDSTQVDRSIKASPKVKKASKSRSPSPVKQKSDFTEEELKKPNMTYVPLIDEAIRSSPKGYADLPEIYKIIQKRHPHYRFTEGNGWQSSVRHNLKHPRFRTAGKSGKGHYHAINYDVPLPHAEQKKQRRTTPPPRPPAQMQNGQYMPNQTGLQQFGQLQHQHGQTATNGYADANTAYLRTHGTYQSPYAQAAALQSNLAGQHGGLQQQAMQPGQQRFSGSPSVSNPVGQQQQQQQQHQTAQQQSINHYGGLVPAIMGFRTSFLRPYIHKEDAYKFHEKILLDCIQCLSDIFSRPDPAYQMKKEAALSEFKSETQRHCFTQLSAVFDSYHAPEGGGAVKESQQTSKDQQDTKSSAALVQDAVGAAVAQASADGRSVGPTSHAPDPAQLVSAPAPVSVAAFAPAPAAPSAPSAPASAVQAAPAPAAPAPAATASLTGAMASGLSQQQQAVPLPMSAAVAHESPSGWDSTRPEREPAEQNASTAHAATATATTSGKTASSVTVPALSSSEAMVKPAVATPDQASETQQAARQMPAAPSSASTAGVKRSASPDRQTLDGGLASKRVRTEG